MIRTTAFLALALLASAATTCFGAECLECHTSSLFKVQNKAAYDHADGFLVSVHGQPGYTCAVCHGGDPMAEEKDAAHAEMHRMKDEHITGVCGGCHVDDLEIFASSKHTQAVVERRFAPHCSTCHGSMAMDVIDVSRVIGRCRLCHGGEGDAMLKLASEVMSRSVAIQGYEDYVSSLSEDEGLVQELLEAEDRLADLWHRYDLEAADAASAELLRALRTAKQGLAADR